MEAMPSRSKETTAATAEGRRPRLPRGPDQFRLLVETVADYAIFLLDADGNVLTWNTGAERIKGYAADEIIGRHFSVFYTPEDAAHGRPRWILSQAAELGRIEDEGQRVRKDGTRFWADVVVTALRDPQGELYGFAKVTRDVTERRAAEEHERQLAVEREGRRVAEEALKARDRFLSIASHELKTPIATIQVVAEALLRAYDSERLDQKRLAAGLARIDVSVQRLGILLTELLDVSRLTAGPSPLTLSRADIGELSEEVVRRFRELEGRDRIDLTCDGVLEVNGDPIRLDQVITNLIDNALRYSAPPSRVQVTVREVDDAVEFWVTDRGIGFDADAKRVLFESFGRAENVADIPGMGLGLYISRQIVELHGGTITATSEGPAKGSTFAVRLPKDPGAAGRVSA